jgi:hypothetical protein
MTASTNALVLLILQSCCNPPCHVLQVKESMKKKLRDILADAAVHKVGPF